MTQAQSGQSINRDLPNGEHRVEVEPSPRWVRVTFNGETIADSKQVLLVRETGHLPVYYFPQADVRMDLLTPTERRWHCPYKGEASYWTVRAGERVAEDAVWSYQDPLPAGEPIRGYVAFDWNLVDHWYEEDEEVFVHPRDPYSRVDVIQSTRHVRVVVGGETIAESRRPRLLFETGLPTRYYLPPEDVRMDLLMPAATKTRCPYKGQASYWRATVGDATRDIAWSYPEPIPECPKVRGLIAFFNERVDAIYVDDELQPRPKNKWA